MYSGTVNCQIPEKTICLFHSVFYPPKEEGLKCQSALHKFPASVPRACVFQPPCPHTADLLIAFPPCCPFSFDLLLFIFQPFKGLSSVLFMNSFCLFVISLFTCPDIFRPIFLSSFVHLARLLVYPSVSPSPVFFSVFPFTFLQTHRPFISLRVLSPAPRGLFMSPCHL